LALLWAGLSVGVAFVATPAKFLAPTLSLPVALDVGRHTFRVYNGLELCLAVAALALALSSTAPWRRAAGFAIPVLVVIAQASWLIPALDARTLMVQAGQRPPPSPLHAAYIAAEALKILALAAAALATAPARPRPARRGHEWVAMPRLEHGQPLEHG
jgi:hypothetical protein